MVNVVLTVALFAGLAWWGLTTYRRLLRSRRRVLTAWHELEASWARRREPVSALVTALASASLEGPVGAVNAARNETTRPRGPAHAGALESTLEDALTALNRALDERPDAASAVGEVRQQVAVAQEAVTAARLAYNTQADAYNDEVDSLAGAVVASLSGFHRAERA